ncbi:nucleotidyltransferase substrate binding protein [Pedobacter cryotolerans]|uniref:Nucleotidyltransferase n=1 Tax=Pedobacter cryotolerans TaxID=2571270 RepID=A0A4U1CB06_9SPHI|nr:nucleotidyltransferase substrate binding protein [Pedobacter cryotolerans]TKC03082.1 nucleotidyltransferase [Pedobacter cryotolerans]
MEKDIRWLQRFSNYSKAFIKFSEGIKYVKSNFKTDELENSEVILDEIIKEGLIQRFEYTHELGWNVMKDYAEYQGNSEIAGSRDATREAFKMKLISDGDVWMDMIKNRNRTSHTYNKETANEIYRLIIEDYYQAFNDFLIKMEELRSGMQTDLFNN